MQPHSLQTISISNAKTPAQRKAEGGWAARHGTLEGDVLPETQVLACPRVKVADLPEGFEAEPHRAAGAEPIDRLVLPASREPRGRGAQEPSRRAGSGHLRVPLHLVDRLTALRTIYVNSSGPHSSPRR
jgi:hypothetical protein